MSMRTMSRLLVPLCIPVCVSWASAARAQESRAPAADVESSTKPEEAKPQETVPVQIVADQAQVEVERRLPQPTTVCTPPCDATMRNGLNWVAVSRAGGTPIELPVMVKGPSRLQVDFTSRKGIRTAGLITFAGTFVPGVIMIVLGAVHHDVMCRPNIDGGTICENLPTPNELLIGLGVGLAVAGTAAGAVMFLTPDRANINVIPGAPVAKLRLLPGVGARYERGWAQAPAFDATGLRLRYEF